MSDCGDHAVLMDLNDNELFSIESFKDCENLRFLSLVLAGTI